MFDINTPHLTGDVVKAAEVLVQASEKLFSGLTKPTENLFRATENIMILGLALGAMWTTVSLTRVIFDIKHKHTVTHYAPVERPKNGD